MVKKLNVIGAAIKTFLEKGYSQIWISRKMGISKQRVHYWANNPLKTVQTRRRKLDDRYNQKIISLATDKTTNSMSSAKIARIINLDLKKDSKNITIDKSTICRILKKELGKPRKINKVFYLNKNHKKERVKFCKKMLKTQISGKDILFTDESKNEMGAFINDSIRLSQESKQKIKNGEKEAFKLIIRPQKKFEPSIMVAGGISSYGLTDIILLEGTLNEFSYAHALLFYKDSFEELKKNVKQHYFLNKMGLSHISVEEIKS